MITIQKSNQLKSIAALMMLFIHLFNRPHEGLFEPLLFVGAMPLSYYISLFCDACVPIFCFLSGYGLYFKYSKKIISYHKENRTRILKLYINYWIIVLLFAVGLGLVLNEKNVPGSISTFMLNATAISNSYNSAWWFFFTYLLLVLSSSVIFYFLNKLSIWMVALSLFAVYTMGFYFRVYKPELFENEIMNWVQRQICLYATSLLPFAVGALAFKQQWNIFVSRNFAKVAHKNLVVISLIILLIVLHAIIPNFFVAPFLAVPFIFLFLQLQIPPITERILNFVAPHATNMWLVHMFFYLVYFKTFIYSATYVLPIFLLLVVCSIGSSIVINKINDAVLKTIKV